MRRGLVVLALALSSCGWTTYWGLRGGPPKDQLPPDQREAFEQKYREDVAACMERGYATQTYTSSGYVYEGTGGSYGQSHFNHDVMRACMSARGWVVTKKVPTTLGVPWY